MMGTIKIVHILCIIQQEHLHNNNRLFCRSFHVCVCSNSLFAKTHFCWIILFEWAKRSVITLSGGLSSGVRLWLARVIHSSKVLMKVAQVALRREACRGRQGERFLWRNLLRNRNVKDSFGVNLEDEIPLRWVWPRCQPCAVTGLFGPAGRGGHSTSEVQTSLSSDSRDLATEARKHKVEILCVTMRHGSLTFVLGYTEWLELCWKPANWKRRHQLNCVLKVDAIDRQIYKQAPCTFVLVTVQCSSFGWA